MIPLTYITIITLGRHLKFILRYDYNVINIPECLLSFSETAPQLMASSDSLELNLLSPNL